MKAPLAAINASCTNLEELKLGGKCILQHGHELKELSNFKKLEKLYLGDFLLPPPQIDPNSIARMANNYVKLSFESVHWDSLHVACLWLENNSISDEDVRKIVASIKTLKIVVGCPNLPAGSDVINKHVQKVNLNSSTETSPAFHMLWSELY